MITTIIFDLGRVMFGYDPDYIIETLCPGTPHKEDYLEHLFYSPLWQQLDRGDLSHNEGKEALSKLFQGHPVKTEESHRLLDEFSIHLDLIEGSKSIFLSLCEQGYRIYLLSNFQSLPFDRLLEKHDFLDKAHGRVISAKINCMKPEPEIYQHLISTYTLTPEHCVFIDDLEENIQGAAKHGIQGIVFTTPEALKKDLSAHKIRVS